MIGNSLVDLQKAYAVLQKCQPWIEKINHHPLYTRLDSLENIRIFMTHHVFAVWDFMCLLKELHRKIVCTQAPWFPPRDAYCAHLINRILVEEEGDQTEDQKNYLSHFELYLTAMKNIGADTQMIYAFLKLLASGKSISAAAAILKLPDNVRSFVTTTFSFFAAEEHILAAAFVYGREAITPSLFAPLLEQLDQQSESSGCLGTLLYYLKRHIDLDQADHFPKALHMLNRLAGDDEKKWEDITVSAEQALQARLNFLTGIQIAIDSVKNNN